jgi:prepilin-type N-terminal cleavage/methylation domain-containing protein
VIAGRKATDPPKVRDGRVAEVEIKGTGLPWLKQVIRFFILIAPPLENGGEGEFEGGFMNQKGVTLIELVIVMVIIAIGATLMAPGISSWMPHYRLRSTTRDIVSTMRIAQMKAISNNLTYEVFFPNNRSYILRYRDTGGNPVNEGDVQVLNNGVQFNQNFDGNIASFLPDSRVSPGDLNLTNSKGSQKTIRLTGRRIRIE